MSAESESPSEAVCAPSAVYIAMKHMRSVTCAAHRAAIDDEQIKRPICRNWRPSPTPGARAGSRTRKKIAAPHSASTAALTRNADAQPAQFASACGTTCPTIPATKKAVEIAPMDKARRRGSTASAM